MGLTRVIAILTVTWCLLLVWVIKTAESRGRSMIVWGLIGLAAGILGPLVGITLAAKMVEGDDPSTMTIALAFFVPLVSLILPMVGVGVFLMRSPVHVARQASYKVDVLGKGPATITIKDGIQLAIEGGETLTAADITKAEADGECVRIFLADRELLAMPLGRPATREGRQHQSLVLAKQLRQAKSLH